MSNTLSEFQSLLTDTLEHIKDHYPKGKTLLISQENSLFFSSVKKAPTPQIEVPKANAPAKTAIPPLPVQGQPRPTPKIEVAPKAAAAPPPVDQLPKTRATPAALASATEFSEDMRRSMQKVLPHVRIIRDIPSDEEASVLSDEWKQQTKQAEVLILSFSESKETDKFLFNVKKAIEAHLCSCAIIEAKEWEQKKEWEAFFTIHKPKLMIASPELLKTKHLLSYYKENPTSQERFLHTGPLMLLLALPIYLQSPEQKKVLWKELCSHFKKN